MSAPVTQTDIVNAAAQHLGSTSRIQSIDQSGPLASSARAVWDLSIRTLLADHPWNFAIKRAMLNAGPAPAFGYERSFQLPADCLRVLPSRIEDGCEAYFEGEVEDGAILTNKAAPLSIRYISSEKIANCGSWPAHFVKAAAYALAMDMCEDLTGSQGIDDKLTRKADAALSRAKRIDGLETQNRRRTHPRNSSRWLRAQRTPFNPYGD